jgi:hypothetical protein
MMTALSPIATSPQLLSRRTGTAAVASVVAAAALAVEAMVAAAFDVDDHASGAGRVSEALVAVAFLAGAVALASFAPGPDRARRATRALWLPGVAGIGGVGAITLAVTVTGREWPEGIVTLVVLIAVLGVVAQAVIGTVSRSWPWWTGALLASLLPVMFVVPNPYNSFVMAGCWAGAAVAAWRR